MALKKDLILRSPRSGREGRTAPILLDESVEEPKSAAAKRVCVAVTLEVIWIARHVLAWVAIALFLALALNPLVGWIQRRTHLGRGLAIGVAYILVLIVIAGVGATFVPKLTDEVNGFVQATPSYVEDLTHGRGRLGFLETKYHIVEKVRRQVSNGGASKVLGLSGAAVSVTKGVITLVAATITIVFLTFFMLLEGRGWLERIYSIFPEHAQTRVRTIGDEMYRTVGGYVTGNIVISVIAGASATIAARGSATRSAANAGNRSKRASAERYLIATLRPSI